MVTELNLHGTLAWKKKKKAILFKGSLETEHDVLIRSSYSGVGHKNCI